MAAKYPLIRIIFILLISFTINTAIAQPTLPDIAGAAEKGIVILSWNCQYDGVKKITVLHSTDSLYSFKEIGKVKKLDKGIQAFVDGHPTAGANYYRIIIVFNSGLTWSSNRCSVTIESSALDKSPMHLPSNDSLQRYIVTSNSAKSGKGKTVLTAATKPAVKDNLSVEPEEDDSDTIKQKTKKPADDDDDNIADNDNTAKPIEPKRKISLSFDMDPTTNTIAKGTAQPDNKPIQHKVISVSFDDPTASAPTFIRSLYVFTDPATGHVNVNLPNDVATHHYSLKFYDEQNHMIMEIPRVNTSIFIIDKRNFQRKGTYRFVLRKDVTELESGYIMLNL